MRVSHGCVRLYPENIEFLYELVEIGEVVKIMNEPFQMGRKDGVIYFEAHAPLEDDILGAEERMRSLLNAELGADGQVLNDDLRRHIETLVQAPVGVPISIVQFDANEVITRARVVHNIVERDPNEPTLQEVREMMAEVD
jgi:L,D-transpeptidase ErfK/SrfK